MGRRQRLYMWLMLFPAFFYLVTAFGLILFEMVTISLLYGPPGAEVYPSLGNYAEMLASPEFWAALRRTTVFVVIGTPLQLLVGLGLALLVHREFRLRGMVRAIFMLPIAIPSVVTAVIISLLFSVPYGHVNDLLMGRLGWFPRLVSAPVNWYASEPLALGLALLGKTWRDMPISMLILLAGLGSISEEQYEAARTMGATSWQQFKYITVPQLVPAMASVLVLRSIEAWKEFIFPYILAPSFPVLGTLIDHAYHVAKRPSYAAALALVLVVLIAVTTGVLNRILRFLETHLVKA
ncbi:MAG: sugar ABC transporter permease [Bacillota bacterium]